MDHHDPIKEKYYINERVQTESYNSLSIQADQEDLSLQYHRVDQLHLEKL